MSWYVAICFFGASQLTLLCLTLLALPQSNHLPNRLLAVALFVASVGMLSTGWSYGRNPAIDFAPFLLIQVSLMQGPLLYLYSRALTEDTFKLHPRMMLHFVPLLIMVTISVAGMHYRGEGVAQADMWEPPGGGTHNDTAVYTLFVIVLFVIYSALSIQVMLDHRRNIKHQFSDLEKIKLGWLILFFVVILARYCLEIVFHLVSVWVDLGFKWRRFVQLLISLLMYYFIFFMALRQRLIFTEDLPVAVVNDQEESAGVDRSQDDVEPETGKYQFSSLDETMVANLWGRLLRLMDEERPYLVNGLKAGQLASMLNCSIDHLSQTINVSGDHNFFNFINRYRCQHAAQLLLDRPDMPINQVGESSGFNSQSTFYSQFKKQLGVTPRQYRLNH